MRNLIKPKFQYFLTPLTYVYICVIAVINYILWREPKKAIKILVIGFIFSVVFFLVKPELMIILGLPDILEGSIGIIYLYAISTPASIYLIKDQEKYIKNS
ncbi:hypothetical protein Q428_14050 [Fervidicella metallireducens AeB]|uniref:Uncharacterized protein n=1 Tax=Fervidicella metallireducens AeB TaxID=1403537 RepID=A0A017RRA9_9CLOT|nr:hypothetical protein [Fervidicella metallireducens]EYE87303.1 hypothetical protein Q428_14050 [Fervidicella metallireducens AeB]